MSRMLMFIFLATLGVYVGCSTSPTTTSGPSISPEASKYLLADEPAEAKSIVDARESSQDGEEVTLVGRIGGSVSPFIAGRAAFTVVDTLFIPCSERESDSCQTPWDYCCDTDRLPKGTAMVKLVDDQGKTIPLDAKTQLGMKELQTVIVRGKAKRDEAGNLTVLAPAVFVKK